MEDFEKKYFRFDFVNACLWKKIINSGERNAIEEECPENLEEDENTSPN